MDRHEQHEDLQVELEMVFIGEHPTMSTFEKPQPGNPHQLTVKQHCFPKCCIARFSDSNGTVEVKCKSSEGTFRAKPDAPIFCAKRAWDQRAESGYMLTIENDYRGYADQLLSSGDTTVSAEGAKIVSAMYCLWSLRESLRDADIDEGPIPGIVDVSVKLSKDDIEHLEKNNISSIRPDFTIPARQIVGGLLQTKLNRSLRQFKGTKWHLMTSSSVDFIVPDSSLKRMILPLTPSLCFYHEHEPTINGGAIDTLLFNRLSIAGCLEYYFGRNLTRI
ncbi:MAG: hypothetical protein HOO88_05695 [Kiritimatiellaceae bacterium]|nr:hypothetical protein [Kiritimatiellaceae bacterium]